MKTRKKNHKAGERHNFLMLTGKGYIGENKELYVEYICDCGNIGWAIYINIRRNNTKSCGCLQKKKASERFRKHGLSSHPLYDIWRAMISRCYNGNNKAYPNYGGRGITVCEEWLNSFEKFMYWSLENGWSEGLSIDREKNDGIYQPQNCRWTNDAVQSRNKRTNIFIEAFGEKKCLMDWQRDERCSIRWMSIVLRLNKGWSPEKAISQPSTSYNKDAIYVKHNQYI